MDSDAKRWKAICQDPGDGSGDLIVDLPPDLIASLGLRVGDVLTMVVIHGAIVLTPEPKDSAPT